ncbi:energy transducer TonB [Hyunsoonleella rubra]|uniref:Energy transducer TonB n=1 Tax=Hyunsoonleella rubra TaxID=1737062 RepID=A0ABW5T711_9FLAO
MENQIENIELINSYLNKELTGSARTDFENRLKTDEDFRLLYHEHLVFLEGIKRQKIKYDIKAGKQRHLRGKWLRYFGFSGFIIVLVVFSINLFNTKTNELKSNELDKPEIKKDSVLEINSKVVSERKTILKDTLKVQAIPQKKNIATIKNEIKKVTIKIPEKPSQKFIIATKKDTTIICKEGTEIRIKANSFVEQNGSPVPGEVDLEVTEYYKLSDIVLANLSTQSDGKQLETGGMLHIQATKGKEALKLKEGTGIALLFPEKSRKKGMQLFTGEWSEGIINWKLQKKNIVEVEDIEIEKVEEDIEVPFAVVEEVPVFPGCENGNKNDKKNCMSKKISDFVSRTFNTELASELGLSGRQRVNVIFKIGKTGGITDVRARANHPLLEEEAKRVIGLLPKMKPGMQRGRTVTVPYSLPIIFQVEGNSNSRVISTRTSSRVNTPVSDSTIIENVGQRIASTKTNISASEISIYILRSSALGWINCDRFRYNRSRIKYKLKIKSSEGATVSMVFKTVNSVMPSWRRGNEYDFRTVPEGEEIVLVAIKKDKGKLYFDFVETTTQANPIIDFNFKEITPEELKRQLQKLN